MIKFYGPLGETVENPDDNFLREIVFGKDEAYWEQGSGDSSFETDECEEALVFFYMESHGFFIMRHPDYLVPVSEETETDTVEHYVGGEPFIVPVCSFVSREEAYKILRYFVEEQKVPDCVEWIDMYEIIDYEE